MHAFIQKGIKQREEMVEDVLAARGITFWGSDDWDYEFKREMRFHIGDPPGAVLPNPAMKERLRVEGISKNTTSRYHPYTYNAHAQIQSSPVQSSLARPRHAPGGTRVIGV